MNKKPMPIVVLAILQILTPISNIFISAWFSHLPVGRYLQILVHLNTWLFFWDFVIIYIAAAYAIYSVKRWSYPVFILTAAWNIFRTMQTSGVFHNWHHIPPYIPLVMIGNIALVSYFLIPAVRAPYFNPRMRWWETLPRYWLGAHGQLSDSGTLRECDILNLSLGGAFVRTQVELKEGSTVRLRFSFAKIDLEIPGVVLRRVNPDKSGSLSYGLQFKDVDQPAYLRLARLVRALDLLDYERRPERSNFFDEFRSWATALATTGRGLIPDRIDLMEKTGPSSEKIA